MKELFEIDLLMKINNPHHYQWQPFAWTNLPYQWQPFAWTNLHYQWQPFAWTNLPYQWQPFAWTNLPYQWQPFAWTNLPYHWQPFAWTNLPYQWQPFAWGRAGFSPRVPGTAAESLACGMPWPSPADTPALQWIAGDRSVVPAKDKTHIN